MADPKHPRKFDEAFKRQIVQLYEGGKSPAEIKAEYDIGSSTLHRWVRGIREHGSTRAADCFLQLNFLGFHNLFFFGFHSLSKDAVPLAS